MPEPWFFDLKRVPQDDNHGCAIAATATVLGYTYQRTKSEFEKRHVSDGDELHVDTDQALAVIRAAGFNAKLVNDFRRHKDKPLIVFFQWPPMVGSGCHAIVWDPKAKRFIDPGGDHFYRTTQMYTSYWLRHRYMSIALSP